MPFSPLRAPRAILACVVSAGGGAPAAVHAQSVPPSLGTEVRITTTTPVVDPRLPVGASTTTRVTGRLLHADSAALTVRTRSGWQLTVPRSDVRAFDERRGNGLCAGLARRASCAVTGAASAAALGWLVGGMSAETSRKEFPPVPAAESFAAEKRRVRGVRRRKGAAVGLVFGFGSSFGFGRDRWRPVVAWPAAPTR